MTCGKNKNTMKWREFWVTASSFIIPLTIIERMIRWNHVFHGTRKIFTKIKMLFGNLCRHEKVFWLESFRFEKVSNISYLKPTWGRAKSLSCRSAGVSGYGVLISGFIFCCAAAAAACCCCTCCCCCCACCCAFLSRSFSASFRSRSSRFLANFESGVGLNSKSVRVHEL